MDSPGPGAAVGAPGGGGDVGERRRDRRHPGHVHAALTDLDVFARGLQQLGPDVADAIAQLAAADRDRAPGHRRRAAAAGAHQPERGERGVAEADPDLLDGNAHLVGRDLGERGLVPLAVRHLLRHDRNGAVVFEDQPRRLTPERAADVSHHVRAEVGRAGCGLDECREPESEQPPLGARRRLVGRPLVDLGDRHRPFERGACRHPHVECRTGDHAGGELDGGDEVALPDLVAADAELARRGVEDPLAHPRLDRPRPAVRAVRRLVRRHHRRVEAVGGDPVRPRHHRLHDAGERRRARREGRVGALVHRQVGAQAEQGAVRCEGGVDVHALVACLGADEQVLVAVFDPLHRPAQCGGRCDHGHVLGAHHGLGAERAADVLRGARAAAWRGHGRGDRGTPGRGGRPAPAPAGTAAAWRSAPPRPASAEAGAASTVSPSRRRRSHARRRPRRRPSSRSRAP